MPDHPPWCEQGAACTADDGPAPSLRRAHRGRQLRVEAHRGTITTMLIQDHDGMPQLVLTAAGYAQSRMVDLGTAGMQQLLDNIAEQLAIARGAAEVHR